jgi:hypothetical protein
MEEAARGEEGRYCNKESLVIDTGNPRVFSGIPGPGPVEYPYPLWGYGYSHGLAKLTQGFTPTRTRGG